MKLEKLVMEHYAQLNDNDFYILQYIYQNMEKCSRCSIQELASKCNVSTATIFRFTQKLGFQGYSAFKFFLGWKENDNSESIEKSCINLMYKDCMDTEKNLKQKNFDEICNLFYHAERIFIYGTSTTHRTVAKEMQRTFAASKKYLYVADGETELRNILHDVTIKDLFLFISYSGNRESLHPVIQELKMKNIKYISVTRFGDNLLARNTPYNIFVSITPIKVPNGDYASTALYFLTSEILFRQYIEYLEDNDLLPN